MGVPPQKKIDTVDLPWFSTVNHPAIGVPWEIAASTLSRGSGMARPAEWFTAAKGKSGVSCMESAWIIQPEQPNVA